MTNERLHHPVPSSSPIDAFVNDVRLASERGAMVTSIAEDVQRPWHEVLQIGDDLRAALERIGVERGDSIALAIPNSIDLPSAVWACLAARNPFTILPPALHQLAAYGSTDATTHRIHGLRPSAILASNADEIGPAAPGATVAGTAGNLTIFALPPTEPGDDELGGRPDAETAYVQFSSGSTGRPNAALIGGGALNANVAGIIDRVGLTPEDSLVTWLPFHHDMGLVGQLLVPMRLGAQLAFASPEQFVTAPRRWLEWIEHFSATAICAPNSGFAVGARAARGSSAWLGSVRVAVCGAERIDHAVLDGFAQAGAANGLVSNIYAPAYGMAEATLAVTIRPPGEPLRTAPTGETLLGRPLTGLEVRLVERNSSGQGEIEIRGSSLFDGYLGQPPTDFSGAEWFRTGDLGLLCEGELAITGRLKDLVIVGGRNIHPEDVEWLAGQVDGLRAGNIIAFGVPSARSGSEELVVVAESAHAASEEHRARSFAALRATMARTLGATLRTLELIPPGSIPKTTSGKLRRADCRTAYQERN